MKNGGLGAPLTPIFHNAMTNKHFNKELNESHFVNILNIGGIANITQTIKWEDFFNSKINKIRADDISPGNCLIDEWVRKNSNNKFDKDGQLASLGKTDDLIFFGAGNESVVNLGDLPEELYIVSKGLASKLGKVFSGGDYFGEDFLLENGKRMYVVRAMTYLDVQVLTRVDLYEILKEGEGKKMIVVF